MASRPVRPTPGSLLSPPGMRLAQARTRRVRSNRFVEKRSSDTAVFLSHRENLLTIYTLRASDSVGLE